MLKREAKILHSFLSKLRAWGSVRFDVVQVYMEKECSVKKFMHNMCYKYIKKGNFKNNAPQ